MDSELLDQKIGAEGDVKISLKAGNVVFSLSYSGSQAVGSVALELKSDAFIDKLAALIPGHWDDVALELLKAKLKG